MSSLTADANPRCGMESDIIAKLAHIGAKIYKVGVPYNGRTYKEDEKINWKAGLAAPMS
jgi:hypothetical protein